LLDAGFPGAPHAVVACGSVPHLSAALFGVIPSRSANYVAPQLVAQPLRPSASGACALKIRCKGWGFFLSLSSRAPQRDARCWRPRKPLRGICFSFFVAPACPEPRRASSRHPASAFAGAPHAVVCVWVCLIAVITSSPRRPRDLLFPIIPVTPPPTSQKLIAEIIKLCDIADALGRAVFAHAKEEGCMKLAGFLLLLAGWIIVVAAVVLLLPPNARMIFVLAGVGVEIVGLTLVILSNPLAVREKG
jgi:hypothetical protein